MSFVNAAPELLQGTARSLAGIGSSLADAAAAVSGPTTSVAAAAQDEISIAIASVFGNVGREFQALSAQAQAFHGQFVNLMNTSAGAYASAEVANAQQVLPAATSGLDPIARWQQVGTTTTQNAQQVLGATQASLNTLTSGVSTGLRQLATNPAAFFGNLQTAAQSMLLVGAPEDVTSAVLRHTLGGVTYATNPGALPPDDMVLVNDAHGEVYSGLIGDGYIPTGPDGLLLSTVLNFASSPISGVLIGAVGPFVSPGVALWNSAGSIFADITGGNPTAALGHLLDTPANVVDAFFNGATLNADALAPLFNPFVESGSGGAEKLTGLSLAFGGLFSPGQVVDGASGPMYYGTGGSLFNALGMELSFFPPDEFAGGSIAIPAIPVGPIGATAGLVSILGHALGGTLLLP